MTLIELLAQRAAKAGDKTAHIFVERDGAEQTLSFGTLFERARQVAALVQQASSPGDRVLVLCPPGIDFIPAFYGTMLAGRVPIAAYPPDPRQGAAPVVSLRAIAGDAGATLVVAPRMVCDAIASKLGGRAVSIEDAASATAADPARCQPADLAYLQYTSGSTGSAKGVRVSHANALAQCEQLARGSGLSQEDRIVLWLPVHHSFGLVAGVFAPLYLGTHSVQMSPLAFLERPSRWLAAMTKHVGTVSGAPNFALDLCARAIGDDEVKAFDLRNWKVLGIAGEPVRPDTLRRFVAKLAPAGFREGALRPGLGISEATLAVSATPELRAPLVVDFDADAIEHSRVVEAGPETKRRRTLVGLGRALPGQRLEIVAAPGADIGEVWTSGANISEGYWGTAREAENERTFHARLPGRDERFLRTGDLGFLHAGELFLVGRAKDLIILRGCNYHPDDIEQAIERAVGLPPQSVAAFSVDGPDGEELVIVAEAPDADRAQAMPAAIRAAVSEGYNLRCSAIVCVARGALPKTASAKLQRSEARRRFIEGGFESLSQESDQTSAADLTTVLGLLAKTLRLPAAAVARDRTLASLGMDSLATVQFREIVREKLGVDIPYEVLLDKATVVADLEDRRFEAREDATPAKRVGLSEDLRAVRHTQPTRAPEHMLVTGATGYLGGYCIAEIMKQTSARVVCLVRAPSPGEARRRLDASTLRPALRAHPEWAERIAVLPGDFTQARFGLGEPEYGELARSIDTVAHFGAWVNFVYPYAVLERANVGGLDEVLRFAAIGQPKVVHHMSTTAVLFSPGYERGRMYPEQGPLVSDGNLPNGYEQTKWVADKNVEIARERGFVVSNYRIGYVTGRADDGGDFRLGEFFPAMIKGCIQLGLAPRLDTRMTMVPIDYAAASTVRILAQPQTHDRTFHINHPTPILFEEVVRWIRDHGYRLETTGFAAWRDRVMELKMSGETENALLPYLGFIRSLREEHMWLPEIDTADTRAGAAPLTCPSSFELLKTYFEMFHRTGFIAPPERT